MTFLGNALLSGDAGWGRAGLLPTGLRHVATIYRRCAAPNNDNKCNNKCRSLNFSFDEALSHRKQLDIS